MSNRPWGKHVVEWGASRCVELREQRPDSRVQALFRRPICRQTFAAQVTAFRLQPHRISGNTR